MEAGTGEIVDLRLALAMELKAYRLLLETEEERLGYQPPVTQRPEMTPLLISQMDLEGQVIRVRNVSTETMPLNGWRLRSSQTKQEYKFPADLKLRSGEHVTIWTGPSAPHKKSGDLHWQASDIWDTNADIAQLVDPKNAIVSRVVVTST